MVRILKPSNRMEVGDLALLLGATGREMYKVLAIPSPSRKDFSLTQMHNGQPRMVDAFDYSVSNFNDNFIRYPSEAEQDILRIDRAINVIKTLNSESLLESMLVEMEI